MENLVMLGSLWCMSVFLIFSGMVFLSASFSLEMFISWFKFYFLSFYVDEYLVSMVFVLFFIYFMVIIFCKMYMNIEKMDFSFTVFVFIFVVGMTIFIWFCDWYFVLIGWEILGVVSFVLIFYYGNYSGKVCSFWTIVINRLGDFGLILYFSFWVLSGLSAEYLLNQSVFLLICLLSKSAQFPLSVWLPMAMSAPTPVSALVHSSTLVTAGVFVYIFSFMLFSNHELYLVLWFAMFTIFIGGFSSLFEKDAKKIVALSTLFHLGVLGILLSLGDLVVVYFHLFFHGFFKSFLFVGIGLIIFVLNHNQDTRVFWSCSKLSSVSYTVLIVSVLSLVGLPYFSGVYGKESVLSGIESMGFMFFIVIIIFMSLACSFSYSMKLISSYWFFGLGNSGGMVIFSPIFNSMSFLGLISMVGWLLMESNFLSVSSGVVNIYTIFSFWVLSVIFYKFLIMDGVLVVLSSLVNLYYIIIKSFTLNLFKSFSVLEDFTMSVVLSNFGMSALWAFSLVVYWFSFMTLFIMGLMLFIFILMI